MFQTTNQNILKYPASFFQFVIEVSSITVLQDLMPSVEARFRCPWHVALGRGPWTPEIYGAYKWSG